MRAMRWFAVWLGMLGFTPSTHAEPALDVPVAPLQASESANVSELRARLERLRDGATREASVRTAVEQAEIALSRAQAARLQADEARALLAEALATAATTLAERRLALAHERDAARAAEARRSEAKGQVLSVRDALVVARKHAAEQL